MVFWGAEIVPGTEFTVPIDHGKLLHVTQATLGPNARGRVLVKVRMPTEFSESEDESDSEDDEAPELVPVPGHKKPHQNGGSKAALLTAAAAAAPAGGAKKKGGSGSGTMTAAAEAEAEAEAGGAWVYIGSLSAGGAESSSLDLMFQDEATFAVEGECGVHLAGYMMPADCDDDHDHGEGYDDEDEYEGEMPGHRGRHQYLYDEADDDDEDDSEEDSEDEDSEMDEDEDEDEDEDDEEEDDEMVYAMPGQRKSGVVIEEIEDDEEEGKKAAAEKGAKAAEKPKAGAPEASGKAAGKGAKKTPKKEVKVEEPASEDGDEDDDASEGGEDADGFPVAGSKRKPPVNAKPAAEPAAKKAAVAKDNKATPAAAAEKKPQANGAPTPGKGANEKKQPQAAPATPAPAKPEAKQTPASKTPGKGGKAGEAVAGGQGKAGGAAAGGAKGAEVAAAPKSPAVKAETPGKGKRQLTTRTFPNGMEVQEVAFGRPDGKAAKPGGTVFVNYTGRLKSNSKMFDSSRGKPFRFRLGVGEVIKGWDVGVQGMRVGDKRKLTIPPQMAYGARGAPPDIPGNATLVFDVELVDVK